jgi:outer membrane receptor protein involved in Fe transport
MGLQRIQLLTGVALATCPLATPAFAQDNDSASEIIVTAQRREQTLIKVPQSLSVVSGQKLEQQQLRSIMDFQQFVPGLNVTQTAPGEARIVMRGINTGSVASAVSVYVDDVPFGSSGGLTGAAELVGDFYTFDIARLEVLKGPQGTLYGSNSLGGVVKYVTNQPDTSKFEAKAKAGIETIDGADKPGFTGNAMINLPMSEKAAFRASGYYHRQPGYIDNAGTVGNDLNRLNSFGGRASLLLLPTETLSIRLMALAQRLDTGSKGYGVADPVSLKPFDPRTGLPTKDYTSFDLYRGSTRIDYRLYSGTLDWDIGAAKLTSVTSYATQDSDKISDLSIIALRATINAIYAPTAPNSVGVALQTDNSLKKFTQELRLASADSSIFDWVVGGYYTKEKTALLQRYAPFGLASQTLLPLEFTFGGTTYPEFFSGSIGSSYREIAGFATGTLHLGDRFDITAGGRYSHNSQHSHQGQYYLGTTTNVAGKSSENVFTWSVAPRFEISDHMSIYARVAKGYRPGGPNFIPIGAPANFPSDYKADTVINYEAGVRAETADRSFSIDLSAFYVNWDDIQIVSTFVTASGNSSTNTNGKRARSKGVEFTATAHPTRGFTLVGNLAYTHALLLDDTVPPAGGLNLTGGWRATNCPMPPPGRLRHQQIITGRFPAMPPPISALISA